DFPWTRRPPAGLNADLRPIDVGKELYWQIVQREYAEQQRDGDADCYGRGTAQAGSRKRAHEALHRLRKTHRTRPATYGESQAREPPSLFRDLPGVPGKGPH